MDNYSVLLQDLHTYLLRIKSVNEELEEGPRRLKRLLNKVTTAEKAHADHLTAIKTVKVTINDREVSLKANTDKIKKHKRDLEGNVSKKEFDALNVEIASLEKRNSDLEDEGLALMTKLEELNARTAEFEAGIAKAKVEHAKADAEYQNQLPAWQSRLKEANDVVKVKSALIPDEFGKTYQRLVASEGADALAAINGKSCSACNMAVTNQQFAMLTSGKIEICKSCTKMLYLTADQG